MMLSIYLIGQLDNKWPYKVFCNIPMCIYLYMYKNLIIDILSHLY